MVHYLREELHRNYLTISDSLRFIMRLMQAHEGLCRVYRLMENDLWYKDGLCFECLQCGSCCSGFSGTVQVSDEEIAALARRLGLTEAEFLKDYTRIVGGGAISLIEKKNKDCIFFDKEQGCTVYADRPRQCRTWPFWRSNVYSPDSWKRGATRCPGINRGRLYTADYIKKMSENDGSLGSG